jgi:hypothetical protein
MAAWQIRRVRPFRPAQQNFTIANGYAARDGFNSS